MEEKERWVEKERVKPEKKECEVKGDAVRHVGEGGQSKTPEKREKKGRDRGFGFRDGDRRSGWGKTPTCLPTDGSRIFLTGP